MVDVVLMPFVFRKVPSKRQAAPFNTTQFIMNDHGDTIQYLDEKFGVTGNSENNPSDGDPVRKRISRARESSFRYCTQRTPFIQGGAAP